MKVLAAVLLSLALIGPASAQAAKLEVFGGYSVEHIAPCGETTTFAQGFSCGLELGELASSKGYFHGWNGSATAYFNRFVGITADVAGHYGAFSTDTRYSFLLGPTLTLHSPVINPFAHVLFGVVKETAGQSGSQTAFTKPEFALGGGIDLSLSRRLALRHPTRLRMAEESHQRTLQSDRIPSLRGRSLEVLDRPSTSFSFFQ